MVESSASHLVAGATERSLLYECPDIYLDDTVMSLKFSPTQNILTSGQITGELRIFSYSEDESNE